MDAMTANCSSVKRHGYYLTHGIREKNSSTAIGAKAYYEEWPASLPAEANWQACRPARNGATLDPEPDTSATPSTPW
jgi:hypothetical protein